MSDQENVRPFKIVVVGDGLVGKTCMLHSYLNDSFPQQCILDPFDNLTKNVTVDGTMYHLTLWDVSGLEEYERLRILLYPGVLPELGKYFYSCFQTDCVLVCFAIDNHTSLENVESKWIPEVRSRCSDVPIILVGTKSDVRAGKSDTFISPQCGRKMKAKIKAKAYVECSALTLDNLHEPFEEAVRSILNEHSNSQSWFCQFFNHEFIQRNE